MVSMTVCGGDGIIIFIVSLFSLSFTISFQIFIIFGGKIWHIFVTQWSVPFIQLIGSRTTVYGIVKFIHKNIGDSVMRGTYQYHNGNDVVY